MPEVKEGSTRLFPPGNNLAKSTRAPGAKQKGQPFYNPGMDLNRDLSVLLAEAEAQRKGREIDVADALAGTGARALRLAYEVKQPLIVHANDGDATGIAALRKGAEANTIPVARLQIHEGDAHIFLASRKFDIVDIDPYGSPMPFLDAAIRATRHDGLLCVTATDTGALAGTYPKACRRRYDALHGLNVAPWRSEVGLRILAGCMVRAAARFDRAAIPVLSVSHGHWMRVVARIEDGKKDADAALRQLANAAWNPATGMGQFVPLHDHPGKPSAGPLWSGPLHDRALVAGMQAAAQGRQLACAKEIPQLLTCLASEVEAPAFWIVPDYLQKTLGPTSPRRERFMQALRHEGHLAERTHLDLQGIRTNAPEDAIRSIWGKLQTVATPKTFGPENRRN